MTKAREGYIYTVYATTPPKPTVQKIQMLIDVSRNLCLEKMILFGMILSLPSIIHQIPTQYSVCDQHSVLLSKSAIVDANCYIPGKKILLLKEHGAYRLQSALMIFPQVRSSISAEPYNMWKNAIYIYTTFNEAQPSYYVSCMRTFSGKTLLLQNKCPEDKVFP